MFHVKLFVFCREKFILKSALNNFNAIKQKRALPYGSVRFCFVDGSVYKWVRNRHICCKLVSVKACEIVNILSKSAKAEENIMNNKDCRDRAQKNCKT